MTATANNWKLGLFIVTGIAVVLSTAAWIGVDRLRASVTCRCSTATI